VSLVSVEVVVLGAGERATRDMPLPTDSGFLLLRSSGTASPRDRCESSGHSCARL